MQWHSSNKQIVVLSIIAGSLGGRTHLYLHYGKQYLKDCYIEGSVDFIFGNSTCTLGTLSHPLQVREVYNRTERKLSTRKSWLCIPE
ncbi:unnamed protein product, partial [Sphenostylis stenocarpa]